VFGCWAIGASRMILRFSYNVGVEWITFIISKCGYRRLYRGHGESHQSVSSALPSKYHTHSPAYIPTSKFSGCVNTTTDGDSYSNDKRFMLIELEQRRLEVNIAVGRGGKPRNCRHSHHLWDFFFRITYKFLIVKTAKCSVHSVH